MKNSADAIVIGVGGRCRDQNVAPTTPHLRRREGDTHDQEYRADSRDGDETDALVARLPAESVAIAVAHAPVEVGAQAALYGYVVAEERDAVVEFDATLCGDCGSWATMVVRAGRIVEPVAGEATHRQTLPPVTVTLIAALVVWRRLSVATVVSEYVPAAVGVHVAEYGDEVSVPTETPLAKNCTLAIAVASAALAIIAVAAPAPQSRRRRTEN